MSGSFNGSGGYIVMNAGSAAAVGSGAWTMMALFNLNVGNSGVWAGHTAAPALNHELLTDTGHLFSQGDFSGGFGTLSTGSWYVGGVGASSGASPYQYHLWPYDPAGTGTMSHGGTGFNNSNGANLATFRLGDAENNVVKGNMLGAVWALWTRKLADAEADTLKTNQLSAWNALAPDALVHLGGWDGSSGGSVFAQGCSFNALSGAVAAGANPSGFNFSLAAAAAPNGAQLMFV